MSDEHDIFGPGFEQFTKFLKQTAIRTQIAIVIGSSQQEYFKALMDEGLTEDQAFRMAEITFKSLVMGVAELSKNMMPSFQSQDPDDG
jgi:hypothetical protein